MTKKHFIALADHIRKDHSHPMGFVLFDRETVESLANFCDSQSLSFNRQRWLDYIYGHRGPNGGSTNKNTDEK